MNLKQFLRQTFGTAAIMVAGGFMANIARDLEGVDCVMGVISCIPMSFYGVYLIKKE